MPNLDLKPGELQALKRAAKDAQDTHRAGECKGWDQGDLVKALAKVLAFVEGQGK